MKLLLDTCTFLWIVASDRRLSGAARDRFADPDNEVLLSAVSAWEIAVKHRLGRLPLPAAPHRFVPEARRRHRIEELAVSEEAALASGQLPDHHRDPFDRLLVAQALVTGATIVTPDPEIARYPIRTLW